MLRPVVHIVEDDLGLLNALGGLFRSAGIDVELYESGQQFLACPWEDKHGCLLIDFGLPDMDGLVFYDHLKSLGVSLPAIMMTGFGDVPMSVRAMKAGVVDFLEKPIRDASLLSAISIALERDRVRRATDGEANDLEKLLGALSERERQVFNRVVQGKMNKQIAGELKLSEITVKVRRRAVMQKMQARSLAELVRKAQRLKT